MGGGNEAKKARTFGQRSTDTEEENSSSDILQAIQEMNKNLEAKITESEHRTTEKVMSKIGSLEQQLLQKIDQLEIKTNHLSKENEIIKEENHILLKRITQLERISRKNNIVVTGTKVINITEASKEMNRISSLYAPNYPKVNNIRMIQSKQHTKIIGTCSSFEHKVEIMRQKKYIKGTEGNLIFIDNDLTKEDSKINYHARQEATKLRKEGKKVIIRDDRIKIEDDWWQYDPETETFSKKLDFPKRP